MATHLIKDIHSTHQGKVTDKWSIYLPTYDRILARLADTTPNILEIGIQNGGSLEVWSKYFSGARQIIGCDINPACEQLRYDDPRITVVVGDANTDDTENRIATLAPQLEIIIDDGSHVSSDIVRSFARYFPRLTDGGVYIAEDLHCSYWSSFEGGLLDPASSMAFFKRLADMVNHEHWGIKGNRAELVASFARRYGVAFDEESLAHIHSVEFVNSMCVIHKNAPVENVLGPRTVSGDIGLIYPGAGRQNGTTSVPPTQESNPWSVLNPLPEDELEMLRAQAEMLRAEIESLHAQRETLHAQVETLHAQVQTLHVQIETLHAQAAEQQRQHQEHQQQQLLALRACQAEAGQLSARLAGTEQALQGIKTSVAWKLARPLYGLQQRTQRITRRISSAKTREGSMAQLLGKSLKALRSGGLQGMRRYLKEAERAHRAPPADQDRR